MSLWKRPACETLSKALNITAPVAPDLLKVLSGHRLALGNQMFPVPAWLLVMCRGELSAVIGRLMSKYLWSGWKWYWGNKEMPSPFPCSPVIRECSWKNTLIEKNGKKKVLAIPSITTNRRSAVCQEDLKPYKISEKRHIFLTNQKIYYLQLFKDFTNHRKKTKVVIFCCRPLSNIPKWWVLPMI